jgi:putative FmdB family regulatory protein
MPVYVYKCDQCGLAFERKQAVTEAPLCDCPECEGRVRRVIQPVGVVFKGSGWYVTDHRSHNATSGVPTKDGSTEPESKLKDAPKEPVKEAAKESARETAKAAGTASD